MSDAFPLGDLVTEIGGIVGGVPGAVIRYAGSLIREHERFNARVAERIEQQRRIMTAAGLAAYHAGQVAGNESKGSGAR